MSKSKKALRVVGYVLLIIVAMTAISMTVEYLITGKVGSSGSKPEVVNQKISKEAYASVCTQNALKEDPTIDKTWATNYCGCVYEQGVAQFGYESFIAKDRQATQTGDVSEFNDIINYCITLASS